ncbi:MAG: hypothetical protein RLZZ371_1537 [Pseudomonadota bacterium]
MLTTRTWHLQRLFFLMSARDHFLQELRDEGFTVTFIALLQGFEAQATPEGVASATTRTVVVASLTVLGLDFILTAMMFTI